MLKARLLPLVGSDEYATESAYFACVHAIVKDSSGQEVATIKRGLWHRSGIEYVSMELNDRLLVRFEHPVTHRHEDFGPCNGLQIIDGAMWTKDAAPACLARFDEAQMLWHLLLRPAAGMPRCMLSRAQWV
jgi:hypothetical protein